MKLLPRICIPEGSSAGDSACAGQPVPQGGSRGKAMLDKLRALEAPTGGANKTPPAVTESFWQKETVFSQLWMFLSGLSQCWAFK